MSFESGVDFYVEGICHFSVYFPEGKADCRHCDFCKYNKDFQTYKCILTEEYIDRIDLNKRGIRCPVTLTVAEKPTF